MKTKTIVTALLLVTALAPATSFAEKGDWIVRARVIGVIPDDDSSLIRLNGGDIPGSGVSVDNAITPEVDITYMITDHIGVEAIAGAAQHTVSIDGQLLAFGDGFDIFDTWVIPPTLSLQYHFMPESNLRPYVGAGINYTFLVDDDATNQLEAAVGPVNVSTTNELGWSLQAGLDYDISERFFLNLDLKYINVDTVANLDVNGLGELEVDLDINPWVVGIGFGMRF